MKNHNKDLEKIKQINIIEYLRSKGYKTIGNSRGKNQKCENPLRVDKNPNFIIDTKYNRWKDWATGEHGDIIELCMRIENLSFNQALEHLENNFSFSLSENPDKRKKESHSKIKINSIKPITEPALYQYIVQRKLSFKIAWQYLREIHYEISGFDFYAIGFKNKSGGWDLRSKPIERVLKVRTLTIAPKDYTIIKGFNQNTRQVNIFEGWPDFIAALTFLKTRQLKYNSIILNSTTLISSINPENYDEINAFLDNDEAGKTALKFLNNGTTHVVDMAEKYYKAHNDFNDMIKKNL